MGSCPDTDIDPKYLTLLPQRITCYLTAYFDEKNPFLRWLICCSFLCTSVFILLFSFIHLINVTAKSRSSVGQQVTFLFSSFSVHCSLWRAFSSSVFTGRRSVIISLGR